MNAVDTNVLIYVQDPRDSIKQAKAVTLVKSLPDGAPSLNMYGKAPRQIVLVIHISVSAEIS